MAIHRTSVIETERTDAASPIRLSDFQGVLDALLNRGDDGVVDLIDTLLGQAVVHRASDLYFEPWHEGLVIRLRLDGVLHDVARLPRTNQERIIARIKVLAHIITYEKALPQDGQIEASPKTHHHAMRVSTFPTVYGEKAVIRILDSAKSLPELDELGFSPQALTGLSQWTERPQGTLLLTGPSGSGKTTTIYALLRQLLNRQNRPRHVITIEDPVEYHLDGVTQSQIQPGQDFTYDVALKAILRQDPDVLVVGEIRDSETAHATIKAGLTGHLVLSTLHTTSASGAFSRLLDMGVEPYLLSTSITGVLAQRLVRKVCNECAEPSIPDIHQRSRFGLDSNAHGFKKGLGCGACNQIGYRARTAIGEWLPVSEAISEMVLHRKPTREIEEMAIREGMISLFDHGVNRVLAGDTTLDELQLVVYPEDHTK
jgi:type II secretory ATPase GspE/PulE/Tfp pilus assembly ATPase PilB-like protein